MYRRRNKFENRKPAETPVSQERTDRDDAPTSIPVAPKPVGRILRDLSQRIQGDEPDYEPGRPEQPDPEIIANVRRSLREWDREWHREQKEFEAIRNSAPLGAARHVEPRSIHSEPHKPAWKRKLRP
jgi:hypothetical protein